MEYIADCANCSQKRANSGGGVQRAKYGSPCRRHFRVVKRGNDSRASVATFLKGIFREPIPAHHRLTAGDLDKSVIQD